MQKEWSQNNKFEYLFHTYDLSAISIAGESDLSIADTVPWLRPECDFFMLCKSIHRIYSRSGVMQTSVESGALLYWWQSLFQVKVWCLLNMKLDE